MKSHTARSFKRSVNNCTETRVAFICLPYSIGVSRCLRLQALWEAIQALPRKTQLTPAVDSGCSLAFLSTIAWNELSLAWNEPAIALAARVPHPLLQTSVLKHAQAVQPQPSALKPLPPVSMTDGRSLIEVKRPETALTVTSMPGDDKKPHVDRGSCAPQTLLEID